MSERKRKPPVVVALRPELPHELIAERAYYIWLARGRPVSDGLEDWFTAVAQLESERLPARRGPGRRASA